MRFRAEVRDIHSLLGPLQVLSPLGSYCLVLLSRSSLRLLLTPEVSETCGEQAYADVAMATAFENVRIESQNQDQIPFIIFIPSLVKVLKSGEKSDKTTFRLSKREKRAYLTIESTTADGRVLQDLPIQLQSMRKVEECEEPFLDDPKVKVHMPNLKLLAQVVEKMKGVSEFIEVETTSDGKVAFRVEQTMLEIQSEFENLKVDQAVATPQIGGETPQQQQQQQQQSLAQNLIAENLVQGGVTAAAVDGGGGVASIQPIEGVGPSISASALGSAMEDSQQQQQQQQQQQTSIESVKARISIKKFANIMHAKALPLSHCIGCIIESAAFIMHCKIKQRRGVLTYYLPLITE